MGFILTLHGEIRWLLALVAAVAVIKFSIGLIRQTSYSGMDRGLMSGFTGLMDLNLVLGLILLFSLGGGFPTNRLEHAGTMIVAVAVTHASAAWRKSTVSTVKYRNNLLVILVAMALVIFAVIRLKGSWTFF